MFSISKCKKHVTFGCIALILFMTFSALVSCEQNIDGMDYPDEKLLTRISTDYKNHLIETEMIDKNSTAQCEIIRCYGIYNGSVAVIIECQELWYPGEIGSIKEVAGITLFDDPQRIEIWNNGKFYSLPNAYEKNLLSKQNVWEIAKKHNCYGKEWMAKKYTDYICTNNTADTDWEYALDFYYGRYNNSKSNPSEFRSGEAVMFNDNVSNEPHIDNIAGVEFFYQDGNSIKIMINNGSEFLSLQEAYDQNIITTQGLEEIAHIHNTQRYFNGDTSR